MRKGHVDDRDGGGRIVGVCAVLELDSIVEVEVVQMAAAMVERHGSGGAAGEAQCNGTISSRSRCDLAMTVS